MRESRTFAERTRVLNSDEVIRKYFLVFEGSDTEVIYFDAVRSLREEIGINPLIELVPMVRSFSEEGWSNPKKILDRVIENLKESEEQVLSYESLLNRIMEYFYEAKIITTSRVLARSIWNTMRRFCEEKLQISLYDRVEDTDSVCHMLMELLKTEYQIVNLVDDISEIIKNGGLTYEEGFDQICFIVDRDKDSFVSVPGNNQYQYVLDKCREMGFCFVSQIRVLNSGCCCIIMKYLNWIRKNYWRIQKLRQKDVMQNRNYIEYAGDTVKLLMMQKLWSGI